MKKKLVIVVTVLTALIPQSVDAVPVVPNFTQGSMTSTTETTSTVSETINSMNYDTGYQYVITGTNIQHDGNTISSPSTTGTDIAVWTFARADTTTTIASFMLMDVRFMMLMCCQVIKEVIYH